MFLTPTQNSLELSCILIDSQCTIQDADPNFLPNLLLPPRDLIGSHVQDLFRLEPHEFPIDIEHITQISREKRTIKSYLQGGGPVLWTCRKIQSCSSLSAPDLEDDSSFLLICSLPPSVHYAHTNTHRRSTIGAIIAGFAHEVRNPLAAIISLTESAITPDLPTHISLPLSRIIPLVERIENLIKVALSYGKPRPPQKQWHQATHLIQRTLEVLRDSGANITRIHLPENDFSLPVFVDRDHFYSILTNLLQNALQASPTSTVSVHIHQPNSIPVSVLEYCRPPITAIDVCDTGPGISPAVHDKIFEPFFTTKSAGTGLGLALASELARINAGELVLLHSSEHKTTFRLYLPTLA